MKLVNQYVDSVISGKRITGEIERLAVERYLNDLDKAKDKGIFLDEKEIERRLKFASYARHTAGEWARKPFQLQDFQAFKIANIFGWKRENGNRRFTESFNGMARKGAKTEEAALYANMFLFQDAVESGEIYFAATKSKQARNTFLPARKIAGMLRGDYPSIASRCKVYKHSVENTQTDGFFEAATADDEKQDGYRPIFVVLDEWHAHATSGLKDVMLTGMGQYQSPLMHHTTTAGINIESPCFTHRKTGIDILKGIKSDDSFFFIDHCMDEGDDWKDEEMWCKSNPMLGITPKLDFLRDQFIKAKNQGGEKEIQFKIKNLNKWVKQSETFISDELWVKNGSKFDEKMLLHRPCYLGFDLASVKDITAICALFPPHGRDELYRVLWWFYVPEATVREQSGTDKVDYIKWADAGYITLTPGNRTDYNYIKRDVKEILMKYDFQIAMGDPWNATELYSDLNKSYGDDFYESSQFHTKLHEPTKRIWELCLGELLDNGNNPVARWMNSNVTINRNHDGLMKIDKEKSVQRVDGMSALVMALKAYIEESKDPTKIIHTADDFI